MIARLVLIGAVIVTMVALFNASYTDDRDEFALSRAVSSPAYLAVYITAFAIGQWDVRRLARRAIRAAPTTWVRRAFRTVIASTLLQLVYIVGRVADIIVPPLFGVPATTWEPITVVAVGLGSILCTVGWFLPDLGPHLSTIWVHIRRKALTQDLARLHATLTTAVPQVARNFDKPSTSNDTTFAITRYLVENRDAQHALTAWMTHDTPAAGIRVIDQARPRLSPEKRAASIEAAQLKAAIINASRGHPGHELNPDLRIAEPATRADEILHQAAIARLYHTPLINTAANAMNTTTFAERRTSRIRKH